MMRITGPDNRPPRGRPRDAAQRQRRRGKCCGQQFSPAQHVFHPDVANFVANLKPASRAVHGRRPQCGCLGRGHCSQADCLKITAQKIREPVMPPTTLSRTKPATRPRRYAGTQAIVRASHILKEIGTAAPRGLRVVDLCDRLGIERPTVHRILSCLVAEGLVIRNEAGKQYLLGEPDLQTRSACGGPVQSPRNLRERPDTDRRRDRRHRLPRDATGRRRPGHRSADRPLPGSRDAAESRNAEAARRRRDRPGDARRPARP